MSLNCLAAAKDFQVSEEEMLYILLPCGIAPVLAGVYCGPSMPLPKENKRIYHRLQEPKQELQFLLSEFAIWNRVLKSKFVTTADTSRNVTKSTNSKSYH